MDMSGVGKAEGGGCTSGRPRHGHARHDHLSPVPGGGEPGQRGISRAASQVRQVQAECADGEKGERARDVEEALCGGEHAGQPGGELDGERGPHGGNNGPEERGFEVGDVEEAVDDGHCRGRDDVHGFAG